MKTRLIFAADIRPCMTIVIEDEEFFVITTADFKDGTRGLKVTRLRDDPSYVFKREQLLEIRDDIDE